MQWQPQRSRNAGDHGPARVNRLGSDAGRFVQIGSDGVANSRTGETTAEGDERFAVPLAIGRPPWAEHGDAQAEQNQAAPRQRNCSLAQILIVPCDGLRHRHLENVHFSPFPRRKLAAQRPERHRYFPLCPAIPHTAFFLRLHWGHH